MTNPSCLSQKQLTVLLISIVIVALCGIAYELIIAAVSSYLLGNSVYQFSITIGFFMFSMGIGSYISKFFENSLVRNFIVIEIIISIVGGVCSLLLFISFAYLTSLYSTIMYLMIFIIGTLVGLEIPILTRILSEAEDIKTSLAKVLSLDYIGALIGSVAFPLLLLPQLGLIRSSFAVGLINIITAIINVLFFKSKISKAKIWIFVTFSTLGVLIAMIACGSLLSSFAESLLYYDQIVLKKQTPYQKIIFTKNPVTGRQRMYIDGHIQFAERDEYRYHESLVHPVMSLPGKKENILILGGGDGLAAREILKYKEVKNIHLVDIDAAITDFAATYPQLVNLNNNSMNNKKLKIINADAFSYMNQPGIKYDRIIIDMPDPHNEVLNKLYSKEFYTILKRRMSDDAVLVSQSSSPFFTRRTYWCIEKTMAAVFEDTFSYHTTVPAFGGEWGFHMASVNRKIPEMINIELPTKFLTNKVMSSASIFAKDIQKIDMPVNTIHEPKLYMYYMQDLNS